MKITLIHGDSIEAVRSLPSSSIDITVSSPPYNLGIKYGEDNNSDLLSMEEYLLYMGGVIKEIYRASKKGGRICWNVPNQVREQNKGKLYSPSMEFSRLLLDAGFQFFDQIIWDQGWSDCATAWGSWMSPSAPFIRHRTESILIFYKDVWKLQTDGESDLCAKDFLNLTSSEVWRIKPETDRTHPAAFPLELPERCLKLFSYRESTVLDPFVGSGTTMLASIKMNRNCIGIEREQKYIDMIKKRLNWGSGFDVKYEHVVGETLK